MRKIELLAPAKNLECGIEAIVHGADAVYIGAPKFGARSSAGNTIEDVAELVQFAHTYHARIYVALNTLLYDQEMHEVEALIWALWNVGVDALIVQDMGITQLNLPPIPLHASTQTDNRTVDKVRFLEDVGFKQVVLARELSLEKIREISQATNVALECFVHGALCVSYSGQCFISKALAGRSANRGECAQYCRMAYDLVDNDDRILIRQKHLLSLKDMNRSADLEALIDAGITSFKIEGRLKEVSYVKNVTAWYRKKLDEIIEKRSELRRSSSGKTVLNFKPDPIKSFNRGFTDYFLHNRSQNTSNPDTPKSIGEPVGRVKEVKGAQITVAGISSFTNGDGLSYLGANGQFEGFRVNRADENKLFPAKEVALKPGTLLYRTFDQGFERLIEKNSAKRIVPVVVSCWETNFGFALSMVDSDGCKAALSFVSEKVPASKPQKEQVKNQLTKLGNTIFEAQDCQINWSNEWFIPVSVWSEQRRLLCELLIRVRGIQNRKEYAVMAQTNHPFPVAELSYSGNVLNEHASAFYRSHGVLQIDPAFEADGRIPVAGDVLMTNKFCLKFELGVCPVHQKSSKLIQEPLWLRFNQQKIRLKFDCQACEMQLVLE